MKRRIFPSCLIVAGAAFASLPANAFVQILGDGKAHACFMAAQAHVDPDIGIATCDEALKDESLDIRDRAGTLVNRGVLKSAKGQHAEAMEDYESGIRLAPNLGDAYVDRGAALISLNRLGEAMADINKGIGLGLTYPHIGYYNRAVAEDLMGDYLDAYHDYKHVLELAPYFTLASEQLKKFTVVNTPGPG